MNKSVFLINGFHHQATEQSFDWLDDFFSAKGYKVFKPPIDWKYKVMSDNVLQFSQFYNQNKTDYNHVLGFSFGAMIAFISAPILKPDELSICSLSPYFQEDSPDKYEKYVGKNRLKDFKQYSAQGIAKQIKSSAHVFYGTKEGEKFPDLKARCEQAAHDIKGAKLVVVSNAPHDISNKEYSTAIKSSLQ
jgi:hypothetical protein